jgi:hypothetical protein
MATATRIRTNAVVAAVCASALCLPVGGCFFGGRPKPSVASNDPSAKVPGIKKAVAARDTATARELVKSLDSNDPVVRFYAIRGLQNLTGETFGYVWYSEDGAVRQPSLDKWRHWLDANEGSLAGGEQDGDGK